jgi:hypothetical protein
VFANSLNTYDLVREQGPTNVFLGVDGVAEQELFLPLGYKWVVWDPTDTTVHLTAGRHVISLAARSLDGSKATKGDAIVDRIRLSLANPGAAATVYQAELADLSADRGGARTVYTGRFSGVALDRGDSATFWVYSATDAEAVLDLTMPDGDVSMTVNGVPVLDKHSRHRAAVSLSGGIDKVVVTGTSRHAVVDRLTVRPSTGLLPVTPYEAERAQTAGGATTAPRTLASGGTVVTGIGGEPGNANTLTFTVTAPADGTYAMRVRYSNPEQSPATHYNPDPLARHADISVNGAAPQRVLFPHSFHDNNFWELTVRVQLREGSNTVRFASSELPNFPDPQGGTTYASDTFPGVLLRSRYAPLIDRITVAPFRRTL